MGQLLLRRKQDRELTKGCEITKQPRELVQAIIRKNLAARAKELGVI